MDTRVTKNESQLMPPPVARKRKVVLNEDEYVDVMGKIIERDFFPDTKKYKEYLEMLEASDINSKTEQKFSDEDIQSLSINNFFTKYVSEDNKSFEILHQNDLEAHRKKYHWIYDPVDNKLPGYLMLYYQNGKVLSIEDRKKMDALLDNSSLDYAEPDYRPAAPNTWRYRVRNQLMFPPELDSSRNICLINDKVNTALPSSMICDGESVKLLENSPPTTSTSASLSVAGYNKRVQIAAPKAPKEVVYRNTRMAPPSAGITSASSTPMHGSGAIELPHTPSVSSEMGDREGDDAGCKAHRKSIPHTSYATVAMTPSPMPGVLGERGGAEGAGGGMTWGDVCGTPLALVASGQRMDETLSKNGIPIEILAIDATPLADRFEIRNPSRREELARSMIQSKQKLQKRSSHPSISSSSSQVRNTFGSRTPLTPAGQALADKILGRESIKRDKSILKINRKSNGVTSNIFHSSTNNRVATVFRTDIHTSKNASSTSLSSSITDNLLKL